MPIILKSVLLAFFNLCKSNDFFSLAKRLLALAIILFCVIGGLFFNDLGNFLPSLNALETSSINSLTLFPLPTFFIDLIILKV